MVGQHLVNLCEGGVSVADPVSSCQYWDKYVKARGWSGNLR